MKKKLSSVLAVVAIAALAMAVFASSVGAAEDPVGTAAGLGIGMGARALGMGGAYVGLADDANALYYNPAGLAFLDVHDVVTMYSSLFGAGGYLGAGYAQRNFGVGALGVFSAVEGSDEYGNATESFDYREAAALGGLAYGFGNIAVGGALKFYGQSLPDNNGHGFTGDVGVLLVAPTLGGLKMGAVARNVLGSVKYKSGTVDKFDPEFVVGASFAPIDRLTLVADFDITHTTGRIGAEFRVIPALAIRAGGVIGNMGDGGFTAGAGFTVSNFHVDYAYQMHSKLPDAHWLSLGFSF